MNILAAAAKLSPAYSPQVDSRYIHTDAPLFGERMAIDFAVAASREALERAAIVATDLDLIISLSISPDHISDHTNIIGPRLCHPLQRELQAAQAVVFDLHDACWGFALETAYSFMQEMEFDRALVVRADHLKGLDTRHAAALAWASGAAALVVTRPPQEDWRAQFQRLCTATAPARIELLDTLLRFRGHLRAALYFRPEPNLQAELEQAMHELSRTISSTWHPFIEPWNFSPNPDQPQLAPFALPLALAESSAPAHDGLITFDPFRMQLGACQVGVL